MAQDEGTFERTAEASIAALGVSPDEAALDGWVDPAGAAHALGELGGSRTAVLVRAARELPAGEAGAAPEPAAPLWILVTKGSAEVRASGAATADAGEARRVTRVVVESATLPDGAEGAVARVSLYLDKKGLGAQPTLLAAEAWASSEEKAVARVRAFAGRLARALSVPASLPASGAQAEESASDGAVAEAEAPMPARVLARFTLRGEGPRLVLRDFASRGPREGAGLNFVIGMVFAALSAGAWTMAAKSAGAAGLGSSSSLAWIGGGALLTLAAVAFLGVARFSSRYVAGSAPLVSIGGGKLTVAPWVSRKGAVMLEQEGRFGAAIDLGEVKGVSVTPRDGRLAVEIATDHGPFDALVTEDAGVARLLSGALSRAIDDLRPQLGAPNAKQRARARAVGTGKPAIAR